uniref:CCHC-type domain-containing protein n=1 Tax=Noccaea caerulescens TaxID=107243 RepID=A0A1J3JXW9_NOCCA
MAEEEDIWDQGIDSDQSMSDRDSTYMEDPWSGEEDDYGQEPGGEEPEPEPPDSVHSSSSQRRLYEEGEEDEWGEPHYHEDTREESWTEDDSSQGENEQPASCEELNTAQPYHASRLSWSNPYKPSHAPKYKIHSSYNYQPTNELILYTFSGRGDYLDWERNLDEWLYYNHILKEERLSYAISQLKGDAYRWWLQEEDDRWFYKEPTISTWGELKDLLRSKYAPGVSITRIEELYPRCFLYPKETYQAQPEYLRGQGKSQVPNKPLKRTSYMSKNREHIVKEIPSKKVTTSKSSNYQRPETQMSDKRKFQSDQTEVSISESFRNIQQLFDKVVDSFKSTKLEKNQISCCDKQVNQKQEIVSASSTKKDQAKSLQLVCKFPMTSIKHLSFSKDVETGTGFSGEQSKQAEPEEKTKPKLSSLELEPPDPGKSSNPLKLPELICYRCQGIGHMAKACPTKRLLSAKSLEHKNVGAKESGIFDKPDLNNLNASIIHLSLPRVVVIGSGLIGEEADQKELSIQASNSKPFPNTTTLMLSKESRPGEYLQHKLGVERSTTAGNVSRNPNVKAETLQNILGCTQVSEAQILNEYWSHFLINQSLKNYVFEFSISRMMHLLLSLSANKGTGVMEKYRGLEEAASKQKTFSDQHQLTPQSKDHHDKSSNVLNIDDTICHRSRNTVHFDRKSFTHKLFTTLLIKPKEKSREVVENNELNVKIPNAFIIHLSLSRFSETGIGITKEAPKRSRSGRGKATRFT